MTHAVRRTLAALALTAAALAGTAYATAHTDAGTSTRADSVWMVPADTPTPAPTTPQPITPRDSVW